MKVLCLSACYRPQFSTTFVLRTRARRHLQPGLLCNTTKRKGRTAASGALDINNLLYWNLWVHWSGKIKQQKMPTIIKRRPIVEFIPFWCAEKLCFDWFFHMCQYHFKIVFNIRFSYFIYSYLNFLSVKTALKNQYTCQLQFLVNCANRCLWP